MFSLVSFFTMAQDEYYKQLMQCIEFGGDTAQTCGFQVRAKTEEEVMEHAKLHAKTTHGIEKLSPEDEKKIRSNIKSVKV
jgi:predicted small metal-binding protein